MVMNVEQLEQTLTITHVKQRIFKEALILRGAPSSTYWSGSSVALHYSSWTVFMTMKSKHPQVIQIHNTTCNNGLIECLDLHRVATRSTLNGGFYISRRQKRLNKLTFSRPTMDHWPLQGLSLHYSHCMWIWSIDRIILFNARCSFCTEQEEKTKKHFLSNSRTFCIRIMCFFPVLLQ